MKKSIVISLLVASVSALNAQTEVKNLPTTTTGNVGDFLIKDDAAGIPGSTKKINVSNFITTYSIQTVPTTTCTVKAISDSSTKMANTAFVHNFWDTIMLTNNVYKQSGTLGFAPTVTVSAASTINLGSLSSNNVLVVGTGTITSFIIPSGTQMTLTFSNSCTITYNSTSLKTPAQTNISVLSGDVIQVTGTGGNNSKVDYWTSLYENTAFGTSGGYYINNNIFAQQNGAGTTTNIGCTIGRGFGQLVFNPVSTSSGNSSFIFTQPTNTNQPAATELSGVVFSPVSRQYATGNIATQREFLINSPTYSFTGASTITNAYNLYVNPPVAGTNATITNNYALYANGRVGINSTPPISDSSTNAANTAFVHRAIDSLTALHGSTWSLTGNSGTTPGTNFIGTTDATAIHFRQNNVPSGVIDSATNNTSLGYRSLASSPTGTSTTAVGAHCLQNNTSGSYNSALGDSSQLKTTTGIHNISFGHSALNGNTTGSYNIGVGDYTLSKSNLSGNFAIGHQALTSYTATTVGNMAAGYQSMMNLQNNTSSATTRANTAFGYQTLLSSTTGASNDEFGYQAGSQITTGTSNDCFGFAAGQSITTGNVNIAIGFESMQGASGTIITGSHNIGIGAQSMAGNGVSTVTVTANNNVAVGYQSLGLVTSGSNNTAEGYQSLQRLTSGSYNTSIGYLTLTQQTTSNYATAVGYGALNLATGYGNTAVGSLSGLHINTGYANTSIGDSSLISLTTGQHNAALGWNSGSGLTTGTKNTSLGDSTSVGTNSLTNTTEIGYGAKATASNVAVIGGTGVNAQNVGIGTTAPTAKLQVVGAGTTATTTAVSVQNASSGTILTITNDSTATFTGKVIVPTKNVADSSTKVANTAFVHRAIDSLAQGIGWSLKGNSGTTPGTNFIGTTDNEDIYFKRNNSLSGILGSGNTSFGVGSISASANTSGYKYNSAFGISSLASLTTGQSNNFFGYYSGNSLTSGVGNTGVGHGAFDIVTTGSFNTGVGYGIGNNSGTTITGNTAIGAFALVSVNSNYNTAVGAYALESNVSGAFNCSVGDSSGITITTGSNNTNIGHLSDVTTNSLSGVTTIGYNAKASISNVMVLGAPTGSVGAINVGIGTSSPTAKLQVVGAGTTTATTALSVQNASSGNILTITNDSTATFTGKVLVPTKSVADSSTKVANTAFVHRAIDSLALPLTPRVQTAGTLTITPTSANDAITETGLSGAIVLANPTGTFKEMQSFMVRIKDNGTSQTLTFGSNYRAMGVTLPSSTTASKWLYLGVIYNAVDSKFDIIGLSQQ